MTSKYNRMMSDQQLMGALTGIIHLEKRISESEYSPPFWLAYIGGFPQGHIVHEVEQLIAERDGLRGNVSALTAERDRLRIELERASIERDVMSRKLGDAKRQAYAEIQALAQRELGALS